MRPHTTRESKTLRATTMATTLLTAMALVAGGRDLAAQSCEPHWSPEYSHAQVPPYALAVLDLGSGAELFYYGRAIAGTGSGFATSSGIAKWTGSQWVEVAPGLTPGSLNPGEPNVTAIAVLDDGAGPALWAAGYFRTPGFQADCQVARWDGGTWAAIPADLNGVVTDIALWEGSLIVSGQIHFQDGARWERVSTTCTSPATEAASSS